MKIAAIYDNKGETVDRYTVVVNAGKRMVNGAWEYNYLGLSDDPEHYMGFSQWGTCVRGKHLGKRIKFDALPENIRTHIEARLKE